MPWRVYPRDYFFDSKQNEATGFFLNSPCCIVFNFASKEVLESKSTDVTFSPILIAERVAGESAVSSKERSLSVVSSHFAVEFPAVLERFAKVLYSGVARLQPEECLHYSAQFFEAACAMQSHNGVPHNFEHRSKWAERTNLGDMIERISSRSVCQSYFMTEKQVQMKKLVMFGLSTFVKSIVLALMRIAYAEDRKSQNRFVHYSLFLLRDIIEELLRKQEANGESQTEKRTCHLM